MLTPEKHLRYGKPLWTAYRTPNIPYDVITSDIKTDVVIIGAGISGAIMAEELTDAGFKVVILDRRAPGKGSTMATTALLQYEIDQPLSKLSEMIGFDKAARAWQRSKLAIDSLAVRIALMNLDCDLQSKETVYLNGNVLNVDGLQHELILRNQIGLQTGHADRIDLEKMGIKSIAALITLNSYAANPYKLCSSFINKAIERGAKIFAPVDAQEVKTTNRQAKILTDTGFSVTARYVVFTSGYEVPKQIKKSDFKINSTWAIATIKQKSRINPNLPLIWQASDPYLYIRNTEDGRIICGGEDEEFINEAKRNELTCRKARSLQTNLAKIMPDITTDIEFAWSGSFGVTKTGLPLIGAIPHMKNCYAVMAFGGNGITFSRLGAEIIRGELTGKPDIDVDLFGFKK